MTIRKNNDGTEHRQVAIEMPADLWIQLGRAALARKLSNSEVVRRLVRLLLDGQIEVR